ncbi:LamG-like jellyroll fold domain-containing protein [Trichormus sp. NMC-1]|uniref:LamG-like jellyroll fold domain-containing protein n=1 Tax=Trichormus sp. NMC-1 TaxID=1853259 RepID=UPI0008DBE9C7|nr:LamG-like jellyroll fold domain-containing protein [Trichormus sp. NMC-1]
MSNNLISNQSVLAFDGQDDYLVIPNQKTINFDQNQNFCLELWLKVGTIEPGSSTIFDVNIIEKWQGSAFPYAIRYSSTKGTIYSSRYDGKNPSVSSKILVNDEKFHHVAFVKKDSQLSLYVDGIEQSQTQDTTIQSTKNSSPLYVAAGTSISKGGGGRRFFAGQIADLRLWNIARTPEEIQQNMNSRLRGNEPGLVGYYPLAGDANDKTSNANHSKINGAIWQQEELPIQAAISGEVDTNDSVLFFDGIDDNITLPKGFPTIDKAITIEFWAKGENNLGQTTNIFNASNAQGNRLANVHLPWVGQIFWDAGDANGSYDRINKEVKIEKYNVWTHWAFIKDVATGKMLIYRNAEIWHQGEGQKKSLAGIDKFIIGCFSNNSYYWKGYLTEFRIWNIARTPEEIQQNMNSRLRGNEPGLVGYYPLAGDANDKTSNANHGKINGAIWQQEELPIQAITNNEEILKTMQPVLMFDGKDDYVEVPYSQSLNANVLTVSAWVKVSGGQGSFRSVITCRDASPLSKGYIIYAGDNNKWQAWVGNNTQAWEIVAGSDVILNTWTHITSTFDGKQLKLYVNGTEVGSKNVVYTLNTRCPLRIGAGFTEANPQYFYPGQIAEVGVWNKALTGTEIQAKMNQRLTGKEEGLVAYLPLNEGSGNVVTDKTGNGNNGTINGAVWQQEELPIKDVTSSENESNVITGGNTPTKYGIADSASNFYLVDTNNPVNGNGELTEWEIWAENTLPVQLIIYRKEVDIWSVVGKSEIKTPVVGLNQFSLSGSIKVNKGDFVGIYHPQAGCVSFFKENSQAWAIGNLSGKFLFTGSGANSTAFSNSSNRTYSLRVKGNVEVATQPPVSKFLKIGTKGGSISGTDFELLPEDTAPKLRLKSVSMNVAWAITRLQVEYENIASTPAQTYLTAIVGSGGGNRKEVSIQPGDYLTKISGTWGRQAPGYPKEEIITIQFETKQGIKSPIFGGESGRTEVEPFVLEAPEGQEIIGFFGSHGGPQDLLVRLGIYCQPTSIPENQQPTEPVQPTESSVIPENQQPAEPVQPPESLVTPENQQPAELVQPPESLVTPENQQLSQPVLKLRKGFSFDEAILMTTLSKYAFDFFEYDDDSVDDEELKKFYKATYKNQGWELVHTIRNDATNIRGLILKNTQSAVAHQYAISLRGTSFGTKDSVVSLDNIISDFDWKLINYGAVTVPGAKVVQGIHLACEAVADEIQYFFKTLRGELKPSDFRQIHQLPPLRKFACITALADVGSIRLGTEFEQQAQDLVAKVLADGEIDNDEELEQILQFLEEQLLSKLSPLTEPIEVWVTGFSLGAALCQVVGLSLRRWFGSADAGGFLIKVYAIASPKIGNQAFIDFYNQQIGAELCYRIENALDIVPTYPYDPPFPISAIAPEGLQIGNLFLGKYANGGEPIAVAGPGGQSASISIPGLLTIPFTVPMPHSPETYLQLLTEQKQFWDQLARPLKDIARPFLLELLREE